MQVSSRLTRILLLYIVIIWNFIIEKCIFRSSVDEMAEEMAEQLVQQIQSVRDSAPGLNDVMEVIDS